MRRAAHAPAGCCAGGRFPQNPFFMRFAKNRLTAIQIETRLASGSIAQPGQVLGAVVAITLCAASSWEGAQSSGHPSHVERSLGNGRSPVLHAYPQSRPRTHCVQWGSHHARLMSERTASAKPILYAFPKNRLTAIQINTGIASGKHSIPGEVFGAVPTWDLVKTFRLGHPTWNLDI